MKTLSTNQIDMKKLIPLIILTALVGCSQSLDDIYDEFYKAVQGTEKAKDSVWLEVDAIDENRADRTILFFGYYDNMDACEETVEIYEEIYKRSYRCQRVQN